MKKYIKRFLGFLMLSCKKATELIEKREVMPLNFLEKMQLDAHLSMCKACSAYIDQSTQIDHFWEKQIESENADSNLTEAKKNDMIEYLNKNT